MSKKLHLYEGEKADVGWDGRLCIHVAECGRSAGELFVGGRKPWCQPDLADRDEALEVVTRCPSGSLTFIAKDGGAEETAPEVNRVVVQSRGPYYVTGDLQIEGAPEEMAGLKFRAALCRCGQSKNKPFCDNTHEETGFADRGAVGETGEALEGKGPLAIVPIKNGPVEVTGPLTIVAASGRAAWTGQKTWLCRCGHSKNKPFCDGSHNAAGFKSE